MKNLLVPKNFLAITLFVILVLSSSVFSPVDILISALVAVGTSVVVDFVLSRSIFLPSAAIVSGLIIALLFSPQTPLYIISLASIIAVSGKHLGQKFFSQNIFNPAATGLFITSFLFNEPLSWWGVSWGYIPLVITLVLVGYLVFFRMRRYLIPLSFLITYFLILKLSTFNFQPSTFLDPTIIFFSLVMLPEPTTSPNEQKKQIFYGIFVTIVGLTLSSSIFNSQLSILNSVDPLITSLLLGNLLFKFL